MADKTHADVLASFLEYRAVYREPVLDFLKLTQTSLSVFRAFREWNVSLENVSSKQGPANFGEISTTFTLLGGRIAFSVGLGMSSLFVTNPNWSEAGLVSAIGQAGIAAVLSTTGVLIDHQNATIAMHLRPSSGSIRDIVSNLLRFGVAELQTGDVRAYGVSVYRKDSTWIVDASALHSDALFVRIDRVAASQMALGEIAGQLKADEERLLDLLSLEVE